MLSPFYGTMASVPETNSFEVSVKYARGFTTLGIFPLHPIPIVFNMCACSDGILQSNSDLLVAKTLGWEKMDSRLRANDSVAQELFTIGIICSCQNEIPQTRISQVVRDI